IRKNEGLVRWGLAWIGLVCLTVTAYGSLFYVETLDISWQGGQLRTWWASNFHTENLICYGSAVLLAILLFSHARNTTYVQVPFWRGRKLEVSRLDSYAFGTFLLLATAVALIFPLL